VSNHSTKRDANHAAVDLALRTDGWQTRDLHSVGKDFPDIIASQPGINLLVEVKSKRGKLSPGQETFHRTWAGPCIVAYSGEEAVAKARAELARRGLADPDVARQ
jgi:hypothetical protein